MDYADMFTMRGCGKLRIKTALRKEDKVNRLHRPTNMVQETEGNAVYPDRATAGCRV